MKFLLFILLLFHYFKLQYGKFNNNHEQVHLALTKDPRSIVVSWTTFYDISLYKRKPSVKYGTIKSSLSKVKRGSTGSTRKLIEPNNSTIIRYFHTIYLQNLLYNKRYYYKVGD
uniref:Calcineurin-like phosphoesterase domain-containing protein n=1 Tax=Strongyloides stercoralis TaxID=6248 RepID=A0A0K0EAF3_STRER